MEARATALLLAVLLLTPGAAGAWLQLAHDRALTGRSETEGPSSDDVALQLKLDGRRAGPVLIVGRDIFVALTNFSIPTSPAEMRRVAELENVVWRIHADSGRAERFASPAHGITNIASDGERLYVGHLRGIDAHDLSTGAPLWRWDVWASAPRDEHAWPVPWFADCRMMTFHGARLFTTCNMNGRTYPEAYALANDSTYHEALWLGEPWPSYPIVAALEAASGEQAWRVALGTANPAYGTLPMLSQQERPTARAPMGVYGVSILSDALFTMAISPAGDDGAARVAAHAFDLATGAPRYQITAGDDSLRDEAVYCIAGNYPPPPVGTAAEGYLKIDGELVAFNPSRGNILWSAPLRENDPTTGLDVSAVPLLDEDVIFATSAGAIRAIDLHTHEVLWRRVHVPEQGVEVFTPYAALDAKRLYVATLLDPQRPPAKTYESAAACWEGRARGTPFDLVESGNLHVLDRTTGEPLWRHAWRSAEKAPVGSLDGVSMGAIAVSEGMLVLALLDGNVTVFGRTGASPGLRLPALDAYPRVGDVVKLALDASEPGALYRADWGDGARTEWQPSPLLAHAYPEACSCAARFQVKTPDGRTASEWFTFHVGGAPPAEVPVAPASAPPTLAAQAAALVMGPTGWWLLAVATAVLAAALVVAYARRRTRLAREIRAAERAFALTAGDRTSALAVLTDRRAHASRLLLKRKLTANEHAILVSRLAEMEGTLGAPPLAPPPARIVPGIVLLHRYKVARALGEGAYGRAYLAEDQKVARHVVLKLLRERMSEEGLREARAVGSIRHPNVVTLYDVAQLGDAPLLVMEYAEGGSLRDRLARGPLSRAELDSLADGLLRALEAVHDAGAVHRDVKPSNVLLTGRGEVKLADFGIARNAPAPEATMGESTLAGPVGTPRYMSPEQARGRRASARSDLYSAAVTLYEAMTGQPLVPPVPGESDAELQVRIASASPFARDIRPPALRGWFAKALAPDPSERFASAREMREAFFAARAAVAP